MCPPNLTYVLPGLREKVIHCFHSFLSSGDPGITVTVQLLHNRFWWESLQADTITYVNNCHVCATTKPSRQLLPGLLQPLPIPCWPWSYIALDFVTDLPVSQGNTTILTASSQWLFNSTILTQAPNGFEIAEHLFQYVFQFYGLPEDIVSDRGPQFKSRLWSAFFRQLSVNVSLTSGYHPQSNGQIECLK